MTRKLISLMHVSLDGFCAGPKGEMDWIGLNDTIFADVETLVERSAAAVYGRSTYSMMRNYWPKVLTREGVGARELRHAQWVEKAEKHAFSRTLESSDWNNVHLHKEAKDILELKQKPGGDLLIFGSPGLTRAFMAADLIDEYWLYQNPILLGAGIPYYHAAQLTRLKLIEAKPFPGGVVRLHYAK